MEIELDELKECDGCGVIFNKYTCSKKDFEQSYSQDRIGNCPLCKHKFTVWSDN